MMGHLPISLLLPLKPSTHWPTFCQEIALHIASRCSPTYCNPVLTSSACPLFFLLPSCNLALSSRFFALADVENSVFRLYGGIFCNFGVQLRNCKSFILFYLTTHKHLQKFCARDLACRVPYTKHFSALWA